MPDVSAPPRSSANERPSPVDHGFARNRSGAAGAGAALDRDDVAAELPQPRGRDEPGHAGARDRDVAHVRLNVGLCSTYSIRTRSGPQRNAA